MIFSRSCMMFKSIYNIIFFSSYSLVEYITTTSTVPHAESEEREWHSECVDGKKIEYEQKRKKTSRAFSQDCLDACK